MPDLLLELFSEEIPARMQRKAAGDLRKLVTDALVDAGLTYEGAKEYWTPRRLTLDLRGVTARSADRSEERKGPRTDAPEKAVAGFLRGAGLASIEDAETRSDPKKGEFYVAVIRTPGRAAVEIVADVMPEIIRTFPWPKSMRWGAKSAEAGSLKWVRPLQSILCTFGPETEEPVVVPFEVGGVKSGNITYGHRFHAPAPIKVRRFDDYAASLDKARVMLDAERRRDTIRADANNLAFARGLELVADEALLEEVANLVEWPVALMGEFDAAFLDIPDEVIRLTIKENQKCFVLRKGEALSNSFLLVANIAATDGGVEIARGNAKVVNARLADAKFFWETDLHSVREHGFQPWLDKLDDVTFHAKLGSQGERIKRIAALAEELAPIVGADPAQARRAAEIAKADLSSQMVYEFPELQGFMGRQYAERAGGDASVARAAQEHYSPLGPSDTVPTDPVSVAVALADKLDTLVGFWAIDEKPTGSKDPFALRRAALGVIRIVLSQAVILSLRDQLFLGIRSHILQIKSAAIKSKSDRHLDAVNDAEPGFVKKELSEKIVSKLREDFKKIDIRSVVEDAYEKSFDLLAFFHDRLKTYLRDTGARHDLIDAVITPESDDILAITRRVEALSSFLDTEDGKNLVAGTKRAANILAAEEKKGTAIADAVDPALFVTDAESELFAALESAEHCAREAVEKGNYEGAMKALAALRAPVDTFFDDVMVTEEGHAANRLALMRRIRDATGTVADFSKIAG